MAVGDRFCEGCGHELSPVLLAGTPTTACPACGTESSFTDGYCSTCGARAPDPRDHQELAGEGVGGVTDKGRRHHRNEDAMAIAAQPTAVCAVVCDGVSSTVNPHVASLAAVDAALAVLVAAGRDGLDAAYDRAVEAVLATPFAPDPALGPPSCTFLAAVITDARVDLACLGDCRAYWLDEAGASQLTRDDSWAMEQIESGRLSFDEAYADPNAHMITRWLGSDADEAWRPALTSFTPPGPGRVVLCSDGLWNYTLEPRVLVGAAAGEPDALATARRLTTFANDAGGADNITVVIVDLPRPRGDR